MSGDRDKHGLRPTQIALMVIAGLGVFATAAMWIILMVIQSNIRDAMSGLD